MILTCPHCGARIPNDQLKEIEDTAVVDCRWCSKEVRIVKKVIYEVEKC